MSEYPPFLTASAVDQFMACSASAILPRVEEESAAAARGTKTHAEVLRPGHLPLVMMDWFGGREPRYEAAMGWDPATGSVLHLGDGIDRKYSFPSSGWLAGTADAVMVRDGVISVGDLKTGFAQVRGSLGPPERSGQLRLLAWMTWQVVLQKQSEVRDGDGRLLARKRVRSDLLPRRIRLSWLMRPEDSDPFVEDCEITPEDLRAWAMRLADRCHAARADVPRVRPGTQCGLCACWEGCPAGGQALRRLSELPEGLPVGPDDAVAAHFAIVGMKRSLVRARAALAMYVERQGHDVPIGGGKALRLIRPTRQVIDARAALASGLVSPVAAKVSMSRASIRASIPMSVKGRDSDEMLDGVMQRLTEAGAVSQVPVSPHVETVWERQAVKREVIDE